MVRRQSIEEMLEKIWPHHSDARLSFRLLVVFKMVLFKQPRCTFVLTFVKLHFFPSLIMPYTNHLQVLELCQPHCQPHCANLIMPTLHTILRGRIDFCGFWNWTICRIIAGFSCLVRSQKLFHDRLQKKQTKKQFAPTYHGCRGTPECTPGIRQVWCVV